MIKSSTSNTFLSGLVMDMNPLVTPNTALTNCLNGTIVTFNGNENLLLNDMGNGRVETAMLPEGYIPLGTCSYGGIIYIVSYNPDKNLSLIGCFPSPERNVTSDEINLHEEWSVNDSDFINIHENNLPYIKTALKKLELVPELTFSPGDKFKIYFAEAPELTENISDYGSEEHIVGIKPKYLRIHVVSISSDGSIKYLDNELKWFETLLPKEDDKDFSSYELPAKDDVGAYYIAPPANTTIESSDTKVNLDKYRTLVTTPYNIYKGDTDGKLALFFELEVIDTFSATYTCINATKDTDSNIYKIQFDFEYTSSHEQIKPAACFFTDTNISLNDKLIDDCVSINNKYYGFAKTETEDSNTYVKELPSSGIIEFKDPEETIWKYTITPAMLFGLIDYLSNSDSIDFSKIGTHNISINSWRYYNNTGINDNYGSLLLTFLSSCYLAPGENIEEITLSFIPYTVIDKKDDSDSPITFDLIQDKCLTSINPKDLYDSYNIATYSIKNKKSYSGIFNLNIPYTRNVSNLVGALYPNYYYFVIIAYKYKNVNPDVFSKSVWTNSIFNKAYIQNTSDFEDLNIFDELLIDPYVQLQDNIRIKEPVFETSSIPNTYYTNYELESNSSINLNISSNFVNDYNTFLIVDTKVSDLKLKHENTEEDINYSIQLTPSTNKSSDVIIGEEISNKYSDESNIKVKRTKNGLDLDISGSFKKYLLYTQIIEEKPVDNCLIPLIYDKESLLRYGITYEEGNYYFSKVGIMGVADNDGDRLSILCALATLVNNTSTSSGQKQKYILNKWLSASPGTSDDNAVYKLGSNTYSNNKGPKGSKANPILDRCVGLDVAINTMCQEIGYPIVLVIYGGGYRKQDDAKHVKSFSFAGLSVGTTNNKKCIDQDGFYGEVSNYTMAAQLYFQTTDGDYKPINCITTVLHGNNDKPTRYDKVTNIDKLITLLSQLYYMSDASETLPVDIVNNITYSNPYVSTIKFDCVFNISLLSLSSIKVDRFTLNEIYTFFDQKKYIDKLKTTLPKNEGCTCEISYSTYLDDSKKVQELLNMQSSNISNCIRLCDRTLKPITLSPKINTLYVFEDNIVKELTNAPKFVAKSSTSVNYDASDNKITVTLGSSDLSKVEYKLSSYLCLKNNTLLLLNANIPPSYASMQINTSSKNKNAKIEQVPNIKLITDFAIK